MLLVEDDPAIRGALIRGLTERGHAVDSAAAALPGLESAVTNRPDLVVLDLGLPDLDGTTMLRMLRGASRVPVIVATARDDEAEIVAVLDAGADDYLVNRSARRSSTRVDPRSREARLDGAALDLTPREFTLLHYLAARSGQVVSKRELLTEVWQLPYGGADKTVDVHLSWLRRKLGETAQRPRYLHAVRGGGVRISAPAD